MASRTVRNMFMMYFVPLAFSLLNQVCRAETVETIEPIAEMEITKFISDELHGHYDVDRVTVLYSNDWTMDGSRNNFGYGLKTIIASFTAIRNANWSEGLNRSLVNTCSQAGSVYLLCQPLGHTFAGKIEVDMAYTISGWKIISRNFRNRREYILSRYLLLEGRPKEGYVLPSNETNPFTK